ncbi:hypothetical protein N802_12825 [Knoellia sinensis KCTC 19936]|uniref:Nitroreductase n=1 Tax=Knoellia sinensis KCTC 19936 TaxID=1385520 RepID=A0A0A0JCA0_9MICO|nr:nitroreductase/quinone reductase family protein [Knoellia sinensis]KGN34419.1 hypothetical protein N802_12825 [Knoellia sinensis KCTC 19936]
MNKTLTRTGGRIGVWMYRTLDGRLASGSKKVTVLLLTSPGRRTGKPRSTCVRYLMHDGGFLVWGTGSGSLTDPDWFRNVRAVEAAGGTVDVQVRGGHFTCHPRELRGTELADEWAYVLREAPEVERFALKARRTIPMAVLEADLPG